jgi:hypothetical protein
MGSLPFFEERRIALASASVTPVWAVTSEEPCVMIEPRGVARDSNWTSRLVTMPRRVPPSLPVSE